MYHFIQIPLEEGRWKVVVWFLLHLRRISGCFCLVYWKFKYEILVEAYIKGIWVKPLVLSLSEQPGQMIFFEFLETILTEFGASSGLPK